MGLRQSTAAAAAAALVVTQAAAPAPAPVDVYMPALAAAMAAAPSEAASVPGPSMAAAQAEALTAPAEAAAAPADAAGPGPELPGSGHGPRAGQEGVHDARVEEADAGQIQAPQPMLRSSADSPPAAAPAPAGQGLPGALDPVLCVCMLVAMQAKYCLDGCLKVLAVQSFLLIPVLGSFMTGVQ